MMQFPRALRCLLISCAVLCCSAPCFAILGGSEPSPTDTRFDAVCGFGSANGLIANNPLGSGTLISPTEVLIAAHLLNPPSDGDTVAYANATRFHVRFRRRADGSVGSASNPSGYLDIRVIDFKFFGPLNGDAIPDNIDTVIAVLAEPVTHITPLRMAPDLLVNDSSISNDNRRPIILAGWGDRVMDSCHVTRDRGQLRYVQASTYNVSNRLILWNDSCSGVGPGNHDSGGAVLAWTCDNQLVLVGVITHTLAGANLARAAQSEFGAQLEAARTQPRWLDTNGSGHVTTADITEANLRYTASLLGGPCFDYNLDGSTTRADVDAITSDIQAALQRCLCDTNTSGSVNDDDFFMFIGAFFTADPIADYNQSGQINDDDFFTFLGCFFTCFS